MFAARVTAAVLVLCLVSAAPASAQLQTMTITRLADGVYGAIYSEMIRNPVQSNALIIIGDDGVCVVDSHYTPSAARATIAEIKKLTPLPVRYVVTTHWHDDHIFGNQAYRDAFPGVTFVAHEETRASMIASASDHQKGLVTSYANAVPSVEKRLATGLEPDGKTINAEDKAEWAKMLDVYKAYLEDFKSVQVVLPTLTFRDRLTLRLGAREVQVLSMPGNTKGDSVIFLPKEKIAAVGDLVVYPVPFIFGGYPSKWVDALESVKALGAEVIVPGHGPAMRDTAYLDKVSALMRSMADQARSAVARGLTLDETRKAFDLSKFHDLFVEGKEAREGTYASSILNSGVAAAYEEAKAAIIKTRT